MSLSYVILLLLDMLFEVACFSDVRSVAVLTRYPIYHSRVAFRFQWVFHADHLAS